MKTLLVVTTAPWMPERAPLVKRLRDQLEPECKAVEKPDDFRAEVIAVGPDVDDAEIKPGVHVQILTWSEAATGTRRSMYTGKDGPDGSLWVEYPDDFAGFVYADTVPPLRGEHAAE